MSLLITTREKPHSARQLVSAALTGLSQPYLYVISWLSSTDALEKSIEAELVSRLLADETNRTWTATYVAHRRQTLDLQPLPALSGHAAEPSEECALRDYDLLAQAALEDRKPLDNKRNCMLRYLMNEDYPAAEITLTHIFNKFPNELQLLWTQSDVETPKLIGNCYDWALAVILCNAMMGDLLWMECKTTKLLLSFLPDWELMLKEWCWYGECDEFLDRLKLAVEIDPLLARLGPRLKAKLSAEFAGRREKLRERNTVTLPSRTKDLIAKLELEVAVAQKKIEINQMRNNWRLGGAEHAPIS